MHLRRFHLFAFTALATLFVIYLLRSRHTESSGVDWSRFAVSQYATDSATLCNAVMVFESLERLGSKAERVLLYPREWDTTVENAVDRDSQLLILARDQYRVKLKPIELLAVGGKEIAGTFGRYLIRLKAVTFVCMS